GDLTASYFKGKALEGEPVKSQTETRINHVWTPRRPSPAGMENFSARWVGHVHYDVAGEYLAITRSDDGIRVFIDGKKVIDHWDDHGDTTDISRIRLDAGKHEVKVEYYQATGEAIAAFGLVELSKIEHNPALNAALAKADAVVVQVGFNPALEGEGHDRPFDLPYEQQLLLNAVTAHSKKVILVLNSGAGVNIAPWVGKVAAILEAWYPGQEGALALTNIISGDVNPSGKLPTTFPEKLAGTYYADAYPPVNHHVAYTEGLLTGYRWFDTMHQKPLFPFGFGLSYTTFALTDTRVSMVGDEIRVSTGVKNTGKSYGGAEVVQIYVGPKRPGPGEPVKRLKAFSRISLATGEAGHVSAMIPLSELATWDSAGHHWLVTPGRYIVYVGTSSADVKPFELTVANAAAFGP
ncbi:MAG TPA: glycoside hydrolase family 3 C-terminal domain-containing protein, partial [Fimbriimonadaceae bacterium]|nr:glycoside hydrolase family 3 C-terminal domain-containing protein [Fimbriimonadaceae bacterium]